MSRVLRWAGACGFAILLLLPPQGARAGSLEKLTDLSVFDVQDHARRAEGQASGWTFDGGSLWNTRDVGVPDEVRKELDGIPFGTNLVTRDSVRDGTFRFLIEAIDFRVTYGVLFRYRDEGNYYRLDGNAAGLEFLCMRDGKVQRKPLPANLWYVPPRSPTWFEIECRGAQFVVRIDGEERLRFRDTTHAEGRFGFFAAGRAKGFRVREILLDRGVPAPPAVSPVVLKKPYAYWCTGTEARVAWETGVSAGPHEVEFWTGDEPHRRAEAQTNVLVHTAVLSDLQPGQVYSYRCRSGDLTAGEGSLRADPGAGGAFRLGLVGDNRSRPDMFRRISEGLASHDPHIVINVGDIVEAGSRSDWDAEFFAPNEVVAKGAPYFVSIGNHEEDSKYFAYYLPYPDTNHRRGHYYAFRYGCAAFLAFDDYNVSGRQLRWLEETLASPVFQEADWRFVFSHQPAFSVGWHDYDGDAWKRTGKFLGLLKKYDVQFYLNGHTHSYERGYGNGTYHILSGGGGAGGETWGRGWPHVHVFRVLLQFCTFDVTPERVVMDCRGIDGELVDHLVVEKGRPAELDMRPEFMAPPPDRVDGGDLVYRVRTPDAAGHRIAYKIDYDDSMNTYCWTDPRPAEEPVEVRGRPERSGKFTVRILGMDEDGRVTRSLRHVVEYTAK